MISAVASCLLDLTSFCLEFVDQKAVFVPFTTQYIYQPETSGGEMELPMVVVQGPGWDLRVNYTFSATDKRGVMCIFFWDCVAVTTDGSCLE